MEASDGDDDLAASVAASDVIDRLRGLAQRVRSTDDRCELARFDQVLQGDQGLKLLRHDERPQRLAPESGPELCTHDATPAGEPVIVESSPVRHEGSLRGERASQV